MNITLIAGRVGVHEWTHGRVVLDVAHGLAARGHAVTLIAESLEDTHAAGFCAKVIIKNRFAETGSDFPLGFAAWARRQRAAAAPGPALSFSRVVAGDVWFPVEPTARAWKQTRTRGVLRSPVKFVKHHGVIIRTAWELAHRGPLGGRPRMVVGVGDVAQAGAARAAPGARVLELDFWSPHAPPAMGAHEHAALRTRVRNVLGLSERRTVLLAPVTLKAGPWLRPVMDEVAAMVRSQAQSDRAANTALLVVCEEQFPVHQMAVRAGCDQQVRVVGMTSSVWGVLAASDAVVLSAPCPGGPWACGALGRFAATALAAGKPLLAHTLASGAELARRLAPVGEVVGGDGRSAPGAPMPVGITIDDAPGSWRRAIRQTADAAWLARAAAAAREVGSTLTRERMIDGLEAALAECAAPNAAR